jgi:hypothetical protein
MSGTLGGGLVRSLRNATSIVQNEVPGGLVNSSNTAFTTASIFQTGSLRVYLNGVRLKGGGIDFTEAGGLQAFTMVTAPTTGDLLLVDYNIYNGVNNIGTNSTITGETPAGSVNDVNTTFTAARSYIAGTLQVWVDGLLQRLTTDYAETTPGSGIFTFVVAPATGQSVRVAYQYNLNPSSNSDAVDGIHATTVATANQLVALNASKNLPASGIDAPSTDHIALTAGTSKLVKVSALRQDDTTNTYQAGNTVFLTGWGVMAVTTAAAQFAETVNFGVTFLQRPIVLAQFGGDSLAASTYGSGGNNIEAGIHCKAESITTTTFSVRIFKTTGNYGANGNAFYQWIAIGEIA